MKKSYNFKAFVLNYDLAACTVHTFDRYQFSTPSLGMLVNSIQKNTKLIMAACCLLVDPFELI